MHICRLECVDCAQVSQHGPVVRFGESKTESSFRRRMTSYISRIDADFLQLLKSKFTETIEANISNHTHSLAKLRHLRSKNVGRSSKINCVVAYNFFHLPE